MSLATLVQELDSLGPNLEDTLSQALEPGLDQRDSLVVTLAAVRAAKADLASFEKRVEAEIVDRSGGRSASWVIGGLGEVKVRKNISRTKWDYERLVPQVVSRLADDANLLYDPMTGERLPWATTAALLASRLHECFGYSAKVTGLRALGFDETEWCVVDEKGYKVELPKGAS